MSSDELRRRAQSLRAWWARLDGVNLFRAVTCDLQVATEAARGDLLLHGAKRPLVAAASDPLAAALGSSVKAGISPGARALLTGEMVWIDDVLDGADGADPWCALAVASNVTAVLSVPLRTQLGTVAAVTLFADAPAHFTPERREIAGAIAAEAADLVLQELTRSGVHPGATPLSAIALGGNRVAVALRGEATAQRGLRVLRGMAERQSVLAFPPVPTVRDLSDQDRSG